MSDQIMPSKEKNQNRYRAVSEKIDREITSLNSALFVHVDFDARMRPTEISFSTKWKDDRVIDKVLEALGDAVTGILKDTSKTSERQI